MTLLETLEEAVCVYKSTRFIRVRDRKLVTVYYGMMVAVLVYICVYTIWYDNGYQAVDPVTGTTSVKLKGTGALNISYKPLNQSLTVYDAMDLVVPSIEENAFFVTTAMIMTPSQTRDYCPGNGDVPACNATNVTTVCIKGGYDAKSQGIYTGKCCYNSTANPCHATQPNVTYNGTDRCEVMSWCPLEGEDKLNVINIGNFTAFVKVDIAFSAFDVSRTNVEDINHDGAPVSGYNLWTVNEIVGNATGGGITDKIINKGAIILMESQWDCNLDKGEDECNPSWKFFRIDSEPGTMSKGFNYRAVDYDVTMRNRLLRKLYGIRVVFTTSGTGRKFSFAALTVTFGAGLAYLGVAAFVADIVLEKFLPQSDAYVRMKNKESDKAITALSTRHVIGGGADNDYHELSLSTHEQQETGLGGGNLQRHNGNDEQISIKQLQSTKDE